MPQPKGNISFGAVLSEPDYRDGVAAAAAVVPVAEMPAAFDTDLSPLGPSLYQAGIPACVSHVWALMMKLYWFRKTGKVIDFSPRFLDILSAEPDIPLDGGRRPRTVCKVSVKQGCATTATLPNDVTLTIAKYRDPAAITKAAYDEAAKYKLPGYVKVELDEIRRNVMLYGTVSALFSIGKELWTSPDGRASWADVDIDPLRPPKIVVGRHQMAIKGWKSITLNRVRNSWSDDWADKGEANYHVGEWGPFLWEAWAPAEIPKDATEYLKDLPSPSDFMYNWAKNMQRGDDNDDVKAAQIALMILGFLAPVGPKELGYYGPKTAQAVLKYQQARRITPVSPENIGPKTRAALNADFAV